jgi:hypothetical protein
VIGLSKFRNHNIAEEVQLRTWFNLRFNFVKNLPLAKRSVILFSKSKQYLDLTMRASREIMMTAKTSKHRMKKKQLILDVKTPWGSKTKMITLYLEI